MAENESIELHRKAWAAHLGLLTLADDIIGNVLDDLTQLNISEQTAVFCTSDHGHHLGQHNMFGINELYEQTIHIPLIVRFPRGISQRVEQLVNHLDIVPTILDLTGISKHKSMMSLALVILMLSMAGIPPFAGFFGKFYIFMAAIESDLVFLAVLGVISSVISAFYYLRIIKIMYFDELEKSNFQILLSSQSFLILMIATFFIIFFIFYPSFLISIASNISIDYFK